jgi:hypothetical protein
MVLANVPLMPRSPGDLTLPVRLLADAHDRKVSFAEEKKGVVRGCSRLFVISVVKRRGGRGTGGG